MLSNFSSGLSISLVFSSCICLHNYRKIVSCFTDNFLFNCRTENCLGLFHFICLSIYLTLFFWSLASVLIFFNAENIPVSTWLPLFIGFSDICIIMFFSFSSNLYSGNWSFNSLQDFPSCANNLPLNSRSAATDLSFFSCKGITFDSQNCL